MKSRSFALRVAGTIFGIVALFHLVRLITGVSIWIATYYLPLWLNLAGFLGAAFLCAWFWHLSGKQYS